MADREGITDTWITSFEPYILQYGGDDGYLDATIVRANISKPRLYLTSIYWAFTTVSHQIPAHFTLTGSFPCRACSRSYGGFRECQSIHARRRKTGTEKSSAVEWCLGDGSCYGGDCGGLVRAVPLQMFVLRSNECCLQNCRLQRFNSSSDILAGSFLLS